MSSSKAKNVKAPGKENLKQQDVTQAVVIADSFNQKFLPLTNDKPMVLLPVVNGVILDYILQALEECGIEEIFIFCSAHSQLIRNYVSTSKWTGPSSAVSVTVLSSTSFMSMGDMMRELDTKALIRSDFVLLNGNIITTFALGSILEEHRKLRQSDKNAALTLICRKALPSHKIRCREHDFLIAVESKSKRIRFYQRMNKSKSLNIPLEVFQENDEVDVHYDLMDCHISICSPCVPPLFSDNFDYQNLDDFVKGLIVNEELLGNSMYLHVPEEGYGASMSNFCMYDSVSQDILSRWSFPVVPDNSETKDNRYSHSTHNIYKGRDVEIGRNCNINQNVVIGKGTKIGDNTYVSNTVLGQNCVIGKDTIIEGSYLWNNVEIGIGCTLNSCLLADKVVLQDNVVIEQGSVLGEEVVIGKGITVKALSKLQAKPFDDDDSFGDDDYDDGNDDHGNVKHSQDQACDITLVGIEGHGFLCRTASESDDEDIENDEVEDIWGKVVIDESEEDDEVESSSGEYVPGGSDANEESGDADESDDDTVYFYNEVFESLQRGIEEKIKSENLILEINSSKHAYNVTMKEVNTLMVKALLMLPLKSQSSITTAQQYISAMKPNLNFFQPLVSNYIRSGDSQLDCLSSVEDFMKSNEDLCPAIMKIVHFWYDQDILNEGVILKWFQNLPEENVKIKKQAAAFIKWLQEADEESSDE